jgi:Fic family protein
MLCVEDVLREPVLYLSLFFKKHRRLYYDRLYGTREDEGWTAWMDFFLQGVRDTANQAAGTARNVDQLFRTDKEMIERFGRGAASALLIYRYAQANPLFSIKNAAQEMKVSFPTASAAVIRMVDAGILRESSGRRRDRLFLYAKYLDVLNQDL